MVTTMPAGCTSVGPGRRPARGEPRGAQGQPEPVGEMGPGDGGVVVDTGLAGQQLRGHVVHARRDGGRRGSGRKELIQPVCRGRGTARDLQVVVEGQHDRPEIAAARRRDFDEGARLRFAQRDGHRWYDGAEDLGIRGLERLDVVAAPQVEEGPAAELVREGDGRDVADPIAAQDFSPDEAVRESTVDGLVEQSDGGGRRGQGGPAVDRGEVLRPDQSGQLGQARDVGQWCGSDAGHGIREEPHVRVTPDHVAQDREQPAAQLHGVEGFPAEGLDVLEGS